ncbi:insulinase family protein [Pseudomonas putida]|jgi:zinc protease|uniref:M16 family metallopeptidase n=1 Tax=Pseudomonas putida TaxID=303 RepID=UPI00215DF3CC|nr:pitrilysin family protein [Pseudomonas putida]UVL78312.1 insulinase family protein [Pseudomonas putida]
MNDSNSYPAADSPVHGGLVSAQGVDLDLFEPIDTQVKAWTTDSGTAVKFVEARGLPIVDIVLQFRAGTTQDTVLPGLASLAFYMLDEGSQQHTATQQAEQLERLGAVMEKQIRLEHATLSLRSLSTEALLDPALALFIDLVARPAFTADALAKIKSQLLRHNASREHHPRLRARSEAFRHMFSGHQYGNPLGSTQQGIDQATPEDLRRFHQRAYCASNLDIVVVGDLSLAQAQAVSQQISQALPQGWSAIELPAAAPAAGATLNVEQPGASTAVLIASPMNMPANHPQYPALVLASEVLGSGIASRLMNELRHRRGLTYGIYTRVNALSAGGLFSAEWDIAPEYVEGSQVLVETLLREFIEQGPTQAELQVARKQLAGQLLRDVAQNKLLAALLTQINHQRQPADFLDSYIERLARLTPADVRAVMQRQLDLSQAVRVSVGPPTEQQPLPATDQ